MQGGAVVLRVRQTPVSTERSPEFLDVVRVLEIGSTHGYVEGRFAPSGNAEAGNVILFARRPKKIGTTGRTFIARGNENRDTLARRLLVGVVEGGVARGTGKGFAQAVADADDGGRRSALVDQVL